MARRRRGSTGEGMMPLFGLAPLTVPREERPARSRPNHATKRGMPPALPPTPVSYWFRGVFEFRTGERRTRSVQGHTMSNRRDSDIAKFAAYLREAGWLFPDGRAVMVELLGVGAQDGGQLLVSQYDE